MWSVLFFAWFLNIFLLHNFINRQVSKWVSWGSELGGAIVAIVLAVDPSAAILRGRLVWRGEARRDEMR